MYHLIDFTDKKILIAGASSGIGRQTAITLSQLGASLVLVARREKELRESVEMLEGGGSGKHSYYMADLSDVDVIEGLIKKITVEQGALDGLFYAAGTGSGRPLLQFRPDIMQQIFDINYFGFVELVRQVCRKGRYREGMRIVGVSSIAALCGDSAHTAYSASKAAMDGAVRCMAKELADKGICVNTIAPAMTNTRMYEGYLDKYGESSESNRLLLERQYLGIADTQDIANAAAFLLSPAARFITGVCMPVDGGYTTSVSGQEWEGEQE